MQRREVNRHSAWEAVLWQVGDTAHHLRRSAALPHETVGGFMRRALEEASVMGYISEEEAFSQKVLKHWQPFLSQQGKEQPVALDQSISSLPLGPPTKLIFRVNPELRHLRSAPLHIALEGISPQVGPPPPQKNSNTVTWLLIIVVFALIGVCVWLLMEPSKPQSSSNQPSKCPGGTVPGKDPKGPRCVPASQEEPVTPREPHLEQPASRELPPAERPPSERPPSEMPTAQDGGTPGTSTNPVQEPADNRDGSPNEDQPPVRRKRKRKPRSRKPRERSTKDRKVKARNASSLRKRQKRIRKKRRRRRPSSRRETPPPSR